MTNAVKNSRTWKMDHPLASPSSSSPLESSSLIALLVGEKLLIYDWYRHLQWINDVLLAGEFYNSKLYVYTFELCVAKFFNCRKCSVMAELVRFRSVYTFLFLNNHDEFFIFSARLLMHVCVRGTTFVFPFHKCHV